ncbi:uncharacterized protein BT62DRAFT_1011060 [Guyanagaster necrorhizus]|uniref:Uncharacterized protein n=1 Tax=Guyanagaster necrorhizus TaxID=856835 RepID=A0A9P8AND1_9AGAR|nr:uncharacterized protein BT62DRAFT_1011060 [Guyanagaster necrorhizus MCA 3950]KAG7441770.1 hypothetical protein BT62DRAFT_1011060 [Guyanagaster necrorhizus MCA 3950]
MCATARMVVTNSVASMIPPARITAARRNTMSEHPTGDDPPRWSGTCLRYGPPTKLRQYIWPVGQVLGRLSPTPLMRWGSRFTTCPHLSVLYRLYLKHSLDSSHGTVTEPGLAADYPFRLSSHLHDYYPDRKVLQRRLSAKDGQSGRTGLCTLSPFRLVSPSPHMTSYVFTFYVTRSTSRSPLPQQRRCRHNDYLLERQSVRAPRLSLRHKVALG